MHSEDSFSMSDHSSDDDVRLMETMEMGEGNTKPPPKRMNQSKRWTFTYNNYSVEQMEMMETVFKDRCSGYIFEEEVGDEGTPHLQGYLECSKRIRAFSLKLPKQIHWEIAKGSRMDNIKYCSKDKGRQAHYSLNFKPPRPVKTLTEEQLRPWQKGLIDIGNSEPNDRTLHWIWSQEGNLGKTTFCKYLTMTYGAIPLGGKGRGCSERYRVLRERQWDYTGVDLYPDSEVVQGRVCVLRGDGERQGHVLLLW